jgi:hypothetical protein
MNDQLYFWNWKAKVRFMLGPVALLRRLPPIRVCPGLAPQPLSLTFLAEITQPGTYSSRGQRSSQMLITFFLRIYSSSSL